MFGLVSPLSAGGRYVTVCKLEGTGTGISDAIARDQGTKRNIYINKFRLLSAGTEVTGVLAGCGGLQLSGLGGMLMAAQADRVKYLIGLA